MARKDIFRNILEDSTMKESTLEEARESAGSSHHVESLVIRPSAKNMRNLRSRRNLVDSFDLSNDATFELSIAPAIDANVDQDVDSAKKIGSTTKAKKIVPRNRRQLVNTSKQSSTVNTTFELSVVSFAGKKSGLLESPDAVVNQMSKRRSFRARRTSVKSTPVNNESKFDLSVISAVGQKPNEELPYAAKNEKKSKSKAHRARKALVDATIAGNTETFELSVASGVVESKAGDEPVPVASDQSTKKKTLPSSQALLDSVRTGNEITFGLSVANSIERKPNEEVQEPAGKSNELEKRSLSQEISSTSKTGDLASPAHRRRSRISTSETVQPQESDMHTIDASISNVPATDKTVMGIEANLIQSIVAESFKESSIHFTKAPRRKVTLRGRRGNQHNIGDSVFQIDFVEALAKSQQQQQPMSSNEVDILSKESEKDALNDAPSLRPSTDGGRRSNRKRRNADNSTRSTNVQSSDTGMHEGASNLQNSDSITEVNENTLVEDHKSPDYEGRRPSKKLRRREIATDESNTSNVDAQQENASNLQGTIFETETQEDILMEVKKSPSGEGRRSSTAKELANPPEVTFSAINQYDKSLVHDASKYQNCASETSNAETDLTKADKSTTKGSRKSNWRKSRKSNCKSQCVEGDSTSIFPATDIDAQSVDVSNLKGSADEAVNNEGDLLRAEKSVNDHSMHNISNSTVVAPTITQVHDPLPTCIIQIEDQVSKDSVSIPFSVMESIVSLEETSIQNLKVPKRKVTLRGRRAAQSVGDSVVQVDFTGVSVQANQPLCSDAIPVHPVIANEEVTFSVNAPDKTAPVKEDSTQEILNPSVAPAVNQVIDLSTACVTETEDQRREDNVTVPLSLMQTAVSLEKTAIQSPKTPKQKVTLRGRRTRQTVGDDMMQIDYTAQANQQNESNISALPVTESEQPLTSINTAEKIILLQEAKCPTKSTSNNSLIRAEQSAVLIDLSSARRTEQSASSTSVRTSTDVISSTKTEVTHVESTKFGMDHDATTEVVSMDVTIVDKSVSMMQSTMSPDLKRESVLSNVSKKGAKMRGRRTTDAASSSIVEIDFAANSKVSKDTEVIPLEKSEVINMNSSGRFEQVPDTEGSSYSRAGRADSSVHNATLSMAVSSTSVGGNEIADAPSRNSVPMNNSISNHKEVLEDSVHSFAESLPHSTRMQSPECPSSRMVDTMRGSNSELSDEVNLEGVPNLEELAEPEDKVDTAVLNASESTPQAKSISIWDAASTKSVNPSSELEIANEFLTGKSCQQTKLKTFRLRRALVGSVGAAAANETTFEISVTSVAGQKPSMGNYGTDKTAVFDHESLTQEATTAKSIVAASNNRQNSPISTELTSQIECNKVVEVIVDSTQVPNTSATGRLSTEKQASNSSIHAMEIEKPKNPTEPSVADVSPCTMELEDSPSVTRKSNTRRESTSRSTIPTGSSNAVVDMLVSSLRKRASKERINNSQSALASSNRLSQAPLKGSISICINETGRDLLPLPVSPRRVWPSPLRRSGSIGYTCPSISCVQLGETRSRSSFTHSQFPRPVTTNTDGTTSTTSSGNQRRMITVEEVREMEMRLMDISADDISVDQELNINKPDSVNAVPSIHVPKDLTLCGENANVTMLQDMLMWPQPFEKSTSKTPTRKSAGRNKGRRSVQFAPVAEMYEEHSEDKWRRVPLGLNKLSPTRPLSSDPSKNEQNFPPMDLNEISPIAPRSSSGGNLNDTFIDKFGSPEFPQKSRFEATLLGVNEVGQLRSARPSLTPVALEALTSWKDGKLVPSLDPQDLEAATEKTFDSPTQKHSRPREVTSAIDPSMVAQSQWLPPPDEGMEYDMDALRKALHYMLLGWAEPSDPIFIPLPRSAYQRHCTGEANKGIRRGTRIRVHTPIDSWDRVYRETRFNPVTGRKEELPLGYLRYPKPEEVRRRQRLLRARRGDFLENPSKLLAMKRAREARLKKLAAKRRREEGKGMCFGLRYSLEDEEIFKILCGSNFLAKEESLRLTIKLESDVILMNEDTKTLPIGHLIKPDGPSEIPVIFDDPKDASPLISGCIAEGIDDFVIETGVGLLRSGPLEVSIHNITNVISAEQKRRGLHFDTKFNNFFTLRLDRSDELESDNTFLIVQIGNYAIPLKKSVSIFVPRGIPYKFVSIVPYSITALRFKYIPKRS
ncbi:hypothetical protein ACTXT7_000789 [Hymenolepis weldensis]